MITIRLALFLVVTLLGIRAWAGETAAAESLMALPEVSLVELRTLVENPGTDVLQTGRWQEWCRFDFSFSRKEGEVLVSGHGRVRCKDLRLIATTGEPYCREHPSMARVTRVDPENRVVEIDLASLRDLIAQALEETAKELSKPRPEGAPEASPCATFVGNWRVDVADATRQLTQCDPDWGNVVAEIPVPDRIRIIAAGGGEMQVWFGRQVGDVQMRVLSADADEIILHSQSTRSPGPTGRANRARLFRLWLDHGTLHCAAYMEDKEYELSATRE